MSEYFRVLKRLQSERPKPEAGPAAVSSAPARARTAPRPAIGPAADAGVTALPAAPSTGREQAAAYAALFENLRAVSGTRPTRILVFAGAAGQSVRPVTRGLAANVRRLGHSALTAELAAAGGRRVLRRFPDGPVPLSDSAAEHILNLSSDEAVAAGVEWLRGLGASADLILVEAESLAQSVDSALLAAAADGLVIVAETGKTLQDELQLAAERARAVGCRVLGIVMHGAAHPLPAWIRRWAARPAHTLNRSHD